MGFLVLHACLEWKQLSGSFINTDNYDLQKSQNMPPLDLMLRQACFVGCKSRKTVSYEKNLLTLELRLTFVD